MLADIAEAIMESNRENGLEIIRSVNDVGEVLYEEQQRTTEELSRQNVIEAALANEVLDPSTAESTETEEGGENLVVAAVDRVNDSIVSLREIFVGMAEAAAREQLQDQEDASESGGEDDSEPAGRPSPFKDAFKAGKSDPFNFKKRMNSIKASISRKVMGLLTVAGRITGVFTGLFKLVTGIFGRIFAVVTGIVMGIDQSIKDFTNMEGDIVDKLFAGIFGFVSGFSKIITVPLDYLKKAVAWISGVLGFEEFEETLNSFSITEEFQKLLDKILGFILGVKDFIVEKGGSLVSGGLRLLGFDEKADAVDEIVAQSTSTSADDRVSSMREKDDGKLGSGLKVAADAIGKSGTTGLVASELSKNTPLGEGPPTVINNYTSAPTNVNTQNNVDHSGSQSVASPVSGNSSQSDAWA